MHYYFITCNFYKYSEYTSLLIIFIIKLWRFFMNKEDVVERISQMRTKAGLSARELSLRIGKNGAYISRLESKNDSFEPSVSALLAMIEACNSTVEEFFYYDIYSYSQDKEIIELLKTVSSAKKDALISLLKNN